MGQAKILQEILAHKRQEIAAAKQRHSVAVLKDWAEAQGQTRGFLSALQRQVEQKQPAVIAELKRASPSKGVLREDFNPLEIAQGYAMNGASCLSILTDGKYFKGSGVVLDLVRKHCPLPALRKDFIVDAYQVYESRAFGADCILLIAAALSPAECNELHELSVSLGMDVLVEVHTREELEQVLEGVPEARMIGINNRNLETFEVDMQTSMELAALVPSDCLLVSESGIATFSDIEKLKTAGIHAYLVGESLITAHDPGRALRCLLDSAYAEEVARDVPRAATTPDTPATTRPALKMAGLRHVALRVANLEACEAFYTDLLGYRVEWRPDDDNVYLTSGVDNLALHRADVHDAEGALDHIGIILDTPEDVDAWHAFLLEHDVPMKTAPKTHRDGARSFYCYDPAGILVQMIYHPPLAAPASD